MSGLYSRSEKSKDCKANTKRRERGDVTVHSYNKHCYETELGYNEEIKEEV